MIAGTPLLEAIREAPDLRAELRLWLAVIYDAVSTIRAGSTANGYREAVNFINEPGGIFEIVSWTIEIDPSTLRRELPKMPQK